MAGLLSRIYFAGIVANIGYCIYDINKILEYQRANNNDDYEFNDLGYYTDTITTLQGAIGGLITGIVWPITISGYVSRKFIPKS